MIQVQMSDDIRKFETKFLGPFTKRQLICIIIGIVCIIPVFLFVKLEYPPKAFIMLFVAMPAFICGFTKMDGVNPEVWLMRMFYLWIHPRRKYKSVNQYAPYYKKIKKYREKEKISKMSPKEKKAYIKRKNIGKVIYSKKIDYKVYK